MTCKGQSVTFRISRICCAITPTTPPPDERLELLPVLLAQEVGDRDIRSQVWQRGDAILGEGGRLMQCVGAYTRTLRHTIVRRGEGDECGHVEDTNPQSFSRHYSTEIGRLHISKYIHATRTHQEHAETCRARHRQRCSQV